MSTVLTAIMCLLVNEQRFRSRGRNINKEEFSKRLCRTSNEAKSIERISQKFNVTLDELKDWVHFAVTRDPVDRFVSGFVDKCINEKTWIEHPTRCNGCKTNLTCFMERQYDRLMRLSKGANLNSFDDRHFSPQSWRCQFYGYYRWFRFLHYSPDPIGTASFLTSFYDLLRERGVSNTTLAFIHEQVTSGRTDHATYTTRARVEYERQLRQSSYLMRLLMRMYYFDFVLFGYPLPDIPE